LFAKKKWKVSSLLWTTKKTFTLMENG
jgi:hypothetical protein